MNIIDATEVNARYGGVDSILMWPTYTNIGTDARSQFDLFNAMPGGLSGVRAAVRGAQSKLKARRGNLVTRVAGRVVSHL